MRGIGNGTGKGIGTALNCWFGSSDATWALPSFSWSSSEVVVELAMLLAPVSEMGSIMKG